MENQGKRVSVELPRRNIKEPFTGGVVRFSEEAGI